MATWEVIQGDCLEVLRGMPDASVDAVVTDPPYNVGFGYATYVDDRNDYAEWCGMWLRECLRISATVAITPGPGNIAMWYDILPPTNQGVWFKPGICKWEPILAWGKASHRVGVICAPIKKIASLDGAHPCPKPELWAKRIICKLTKEHGTVLDPFVGSGTTGIASIKERRNFIGIELDAGYCEIARRRIAEAASHLYAEAK
jgi:DNA modification methylase